MTTEAAHPGSLTERVKEYRRRRRRSRHVPTNVRGRLEFRETYNNSWLIQRHGFISPAAFRQQELHAVKQAA